MARDTGSVERQRTEERAAIATAIARTLTPALGRSRWLESADAGGRSTEIFKRYQRSEQAFVLALMEMVVQGGRHGKVPGDHRGAETELKSTVALCVGLDARVRAFNERRLEGATYPFVLVDAIVRQKSGRRPRLLTRRAGGTGIRSDGYREILGEDRRHRELRHLGTRLSAGSRAVVW